MSLETQLGRIGQHRRVIDVVPTITAGAYTVGDAVGGRLEFAQASHGSNKTGFVEAIRIVDRAQQLVALELVLFDRTFTPTADNAAFDPTDADLENNLGYITIAAADYADFNDNSVAHVRLNPGLPFQTVLDASLYGQLVVRGGPPTYAATDDLRVRLFVRRD